MLRSICTPSPQVRCSCTISLKGSREWRIQTFLQQGFPQTQVYQHNTPSCSFLMFPGRLNNITSVYVSLSEIHHLMFCYIRGLHGDCIKNVAVCKVVNRCWHFEEMQCPLLQPLWTQVTSQKTKILLVFVCLKFITSEIGDSRAVLMTVPVL